MFFGGHVTSSQDLVFLRSHGFDFGELVFREGASKDCYKDIGSFLSHEEHFFLIAHGPSEGPPNDLENLWQNYYPKLISAVEMAAELGIHFLTLHLWTDPRFVKPHIFEEKVRCLEKIFHYGAVHDILISLENLSETASDLSRIIARLPGISLTLDIGHGQLLTEKNTSYDIVDSLFPWIGHVHLHDNLGGKGVEDDLHLPIGSGKVEVQDILHTLIERGYSGTITLELKQYELEDSVNTVRSMVRGFGNPRSLSSQ